MTCRYKHSEGKFDSRILCLLQPFETSLFVIGGAAVEVIGSAGFADALRDQSEDDTHKGVCKVWVLSFDSSASSPASMCQIQGSQCWKSSNE